MTAPVAYGDDGVVRPGAPAAPRRWRRRALLVALVLLAAVVAGTTWLVAAGLSAPDGLRLEVRDMETGEAVYARAVEPGESFRLEHTHSVTKRPIVEIFGVDDSPSILMRELRFDEFGPNLPAGPERIGDYTTTFLHEDGAYRVLHHDHPIGTIPLTVGSEAVGHVLVFADGEQLRLLDVVRRGEHVEIGVRES